SAAARPMLQLARKVFDDSIIVRPWRKPVTRWLASVSDALRRNPTTGIAGCCARRERPRHRRPAEQRDELKSSPRSAQLRLLSKTLLPPPLIQSPRRRVRAASAALQGRAPSRS